MNPTIRMKMFLLVSSLLLAFSCGRGSNECGSLDFVSFSEDQQPMISILRKDANGCGYEIDLNYCPKKELYINTRGKMYMEGNCLWVALNKPQTKEFCLFDFYTPVGKLGEIKIEYYQNNLEIESQIIKKIKVEKIIEVFSDRVYVFRISEMYCYENDYLDVVYFVSSNKGILGSYISYLTSDTEYYMLPKGNIFEEHIDYSKMRKGSLL